MLVNCHECKNEISEQAKTCPHCGIPIDHTAIPEYMERQVKKELGGTLRLLIIGVSIFLIMATVILYLMHKNII